MYSSIKHKNCVKYNRERLHYSQHKYPEFVKQYHSPSENCIMDAIKIAITNAFSKCNHKFLYQRHGIGMGPPPAPSLCDIAMMDYDRLLNEILDGKVLSFDQNKIPNKYRMNPQFRADNSQDSDAIGSFLRDEERRDSYIAGISVIDGIGNNDNWNDDNNDNNVNNNDNNTHNINNDSSNCNEQE